MNGHDIITIGASAGGVEVLSSLVGGLPADLPASVFVTLHVPPHGFGALPQILSRRGALPAQHPRDGEAITSGRIYVAPPDHHMLIHEGSVRLSRGPRENGVRPAIDPLFQTAARSYGSMVVGVVLSGMLDDGTAGLLAIKERGGIAVVQRPDDAMFPGMPRAAIDVVAVDHVLHASSIPALLDQLARDPLVEPGDAPMPENMDLEAAIADLNLDAIQEVDRPGIPSAFVCPECAGVLWEIHDGDLVRFRCRVGHAWSPTSLLAEQSRTLESALWMAFRALEERAALAIRTAERFRSTGREHTARRFETQAREAKDRSALIRQVLVREDPVADPVPVDSGQQRGGGE